MTDPVPQSLKDKAVADAATVPELVTNLKTVDPGLAQQIEGKSALGSKTLWFTPISALVTFLVSKYALPWDPATVNLVSGVLAFGASTLVAMVMRFFTKAPIVSLRPVPVPTT